MNRNSGLALNTSRIASSSLRVVEVLMHAAVLDQHHVAGLPGNVAAVVHVMAVALEHVEHRAVEMAVLLAGGARRVGLDVRFDRLRDVDGLGRDHALAVMSGAALPGHVLRREHPRLVDQLLVEMAVGAFERADEGALLGPALPVLVFLFRAFRTLCPTPGGFSRMPVISPAPWNEAPIGQNRRVVAAPYRVSLSKQSCGEDNGRKGNRRTAATVPKGGTWCLQR